LHGKGKVLIVKDIAPAYYRDLILATYGIRLNTTQYSTGTTSDNPHKLG
jgi:hypothetical protein